MKDIDKYSKETDVAVMRTLFSLVPYVGPILNELVFDIRGRVKQERLNKFTEIFAEYFIGKPDFNSDALRTEDFGDLFESVIKHVVQTKSDAKHRRYRDILIKQIENTLPDENNLTRYLDLINVLNENEISVLDKHKVFDEFYELDVENIEILKEEKNQLTSQYKKELQLSNEGHANSKSRVNDDIIKIKNDIENLEIKLSIYNIYRNASYYNISERQFLYYKQNLYSKALLIDNGIGKSSYNYIPFDSMNITEFGKEFLDFLINK